jgi:hypothetical protein
VSRLSRRALHSRAGAIVVSGLLGLGLGVPGAAGAAGSAGSAGRCPGATATRRYSADAMTFAVRLDLAGCRWWDGSARNLVMWLGRDDGAAPANRWSMTACDGGDGGDGAGAQGPTTCEVATTLAHGDPEQAVTYQGEATWRWKDATQRVSFETRCTTAADGRATCADPVTAWHD